MSTQPKRQVWFGMKLTPEQKQNIRRLARREGTTAKEALLRLVDHALTGGPAPPDPGSFLDGIEDVVGCVDGPEDLSSNPRRMDGFGR